MIYLITGVPGSGKTLYAVGKLLVDLLKQKPRRTDGTVIERRLVVDGIPGLTLPHEVMAASAAEGCALENWPTWVRSGDVLCCDEVQSHWRPRGMGTKVPPDIAALETHRHLGVDFVLITQNAMLLDQNVRRLIGRHIFVRRLFGTQRALLYEWDGCQTDTSRLAGSTRSVWQYPKAAFAAYRSSELHTKQLHRIPLWFAIPVLAAIAGVFVIPKAASVMLSNDKGIVAKAPGAAAPASTASRLPATVAPGSDAATVGVDRDRQLTPKKPRLLGCVAMRSRCECFAEDGLLQEMPAEACHDASERVSALPLRVGGGTASAPRTAASADDLYWAQVGSGRGTTLELVRGATSPDSPSQQTSPAGDRQASVAPAQQPASDGPPPGSRRGVPGSARAPGARSAP